MTEFLVSQARDTSPLKAAAGGWQSQLSVTKHPRHPPQERQRGASANCTVRDRTCLPTMSLGGVPTNEEESLEALAAEIKALKIMPLSCARHMLPWRLFALGHWDCSTARHTATFALEQWALAERSGSTAEGVQHRLTIKLMSNRDFVTQLGAFAAGTALAELPVLCDFVWPLVFAPIAERKGPIFLIFGNQSKNISEKMEIPKIAKMKNAEKTDILTRTISTIVFTNSVFFSFLCFFKFCIFAENTINIGVSPKQRKNTKTNRKTSVKNWSKLALKTGPSMLRNKIGPVFNARNESFFVYFLLFFKNPLLSAGRMRFSKKNKKKTMRKKDTICEHNCANCSCQSVRFFCIFDFCCFFNFRFFEDVLFGFPKSKNTKQSKQNKKQEQKEDKRCNAKTNEIL